MYSIQGLSTVGNSLPKSLNKILHSSSPTIEKIKLLRQYFEDLKIKDKAIEEINKSFKIAESIMNSRA